MLRDLYKRFGLTLFFAFLLPHAAFAAVSQLTFTTVPLSVVPGDISGTLTVQLQDGSGVSSPATETMDVEFTSTSPTGEFLSPTTGSPVSKTISTGSANKNFRYRDSTEGTFTLTVKAKARNSGLEFVATQSIAISSSQTSTSTATTASQATSSSTSSVLGSTQTTVTTSYVYYSANPLSSSTPNTTLELGAGRARLGVVGSPMEFKVETNLSYTKNSEFVWNFGDGNEASGDLLTHTYEYPGDYIVMLNATAHGDAAVARTTVRILEPRLRISYADSERIEISNESDDEVSLFGRALWVGQNSFVFPKDTILAARGRISFGAKVTHMHPLNEAEVQILVIGETERPKIAQKLLEEKEARIREIQSKITSLKRELEQRFIVDSSRTSSVSISPLEPEQEKIQEESSPITPTSDAAANGWQQVLKRFFLGL